MGRAAGGDGMRQAGGGSGKRQAGGDRGGGRRQEGTGRGHLAGTVVAVVRHVIETGVEWVPPRLATRPDAGQSADNSQAVCSPG